MLAFKTVTKKHMEILFVPFQFGRSMRLGVTPLPGRSCSVSGTLSVDTHSVSGLFSVSSLAARYVYELLKENCKGRGHTAIVYLPCHAITELSLAIQPVLLWDRKIPTNDSCEHKQLLGFSARGEALSPNTARSVRVPQAASCSL